MEAKVRSHFNATAGVSLVLPEDWIEVRQPEFDAMFQSMALSQYNPSLTIDRFKVRDSQPGMYRQAAEESPDHRANEFQSLGIQDLTIDNYPAACHTYTWYDPKKQVTVIQQFIFVQVGEYMVRFIVTAHKSQWLKYQKIFEKAIASVRFIML